MPKVFTSASQKTGEIGEGVAARYFEKQGYRILERNFTRKWGEIDIVAEKGIGQGSELHFIEVKSVSRDLSGGVDGVDEISVDQYKPEDNMHPWKLQRLSRTIMTYLLEKNIPDEKIWQFDLACVYLDLVHKKAKVVVEENIIL